MKHQIERMQAAMKVSINETAGLQKKSQEADLERLQKVVAANDTKRLKLDHHFADPTDSTPTNGDNNAPYNSADSQVDEVKESNVSVANLTPLGAPTSDLIADWQTTPLALQSSLLANIQESDQRNRHSPGHKKRRRRKHGHSKCSKAPVQDNDDEAIDWEPGPGDYLKTKSRPTQTPSSIVKPVSNPAHAKISPAAGYVLQDSVEASRRAPLNAPAASTAMSLNAPATDTATFLNHQASRKFANPSIFRQHAISAYTSTKSLAISKFVNFGTQQNTDVVQDPNNSRFSLPGFLAPARTVICNIGHHHVPGRDFCYNYESRQYYTPAEPCDFKKSDWGTAAKPQPSSHQGFLAPARKETCNMGHHHVPGREFCYNYESRQYYTPAEPCDFKPPVSGNMPKPLLSTVHPLAGLNPPTAPRSMLEQQGSSPSGVGSVTEYTYATPGASKTHRRYGPEGYQARLEAEKAGEFGRESKKRKYDK